MAHDEHGVRVVGCHLIQGQGMAVFQMGPGKGRQPHVDGHGLSVPGRQAVDGLIHRVRQGDPVVAGVELHPAAALPPQILLHPVGEVSDHPAAVLQQAAVQPHAVVEQVCRVVVVCRVQGVVAHHHPVDDAQLPVDLPQVLGAVVMAHLPGHLLPLIVGEQVQVGVNDLHGTVLLPVCPGGRGGYFNRGIIADPAADEKAGEAV